MVVSTDRDFLSRSPNEKVYALDFIDPTEGVWLLVVFLCYIK